MGSSNQSITFKGEPVEIAGTELHVGQVVPDFSLIAADMQEVSLSAFSGKVLVISAVPSLDTPVCSVETKRFNKEAASFSDDVAIVTVSRDLPFAIGRWCGAEGVEQVVCLSDYKHRTFGESFGCVWKGAELLSRAVFVVDTAGKIQYVDYVAEITEEPDYEPVLAKVKSLC